MATVETQVVKETDILVEKFEKFFSIYESIKPFIVLDNDTQYFEARREWLNRLKQAEFSVAFFGKCTVGKSTIVNAALHQDILPEDPKSTTAFPTFIRRGSENKAVVFYLSEENKIKLKGKLVLQLRESIEGKNISLAKLSSKDKNKQEYLKDLKELENTISQSYKDDQENNKLYKNIFNKLTSLISNWDKFNEPHISIQLEELGKYVEGDEDSRFVDHIDVYLKNTDLPDGITLVDLPGVGVDNQIHIEFTKSYIRKDAKAFVVCAELDAFLEGEEASILNEIQDGDPTTLRRAFLLINKWDRVLDVEKQKSHDNIKNKLSERNFKFPEGHLFRASAFDYSLIYHIINKTIGASKRSGEKSRLKYFFSELESNGFLVEELESPEVIDKAKKILESDLAISDFEKFRKSLFTYLNVTANKEFLAHGKSELMRCILNLLEYLQSSKYFDETYKDVADFKLHYESSKTFQSSDSYFRNIEEKIILFTDDIGESVSEKIFWNDNCQSNLEKAINNCLTNSGQLKKELRRAKSVINGSNAELQKLVRESLQIEMILLKQLNAAVESIILAKQDKLKADLYAINPRYIPTETERKLNNEFNRRHFETRVSGLSDPMAGKVTRNLEEITKSKVLTASPTEILIDDALSIYKDETIKFLKKFKDEIDIGLKICVKNHSQELKDRLLAIFNEDRSAIREQMQKNGENADIDAEVSNYQTVADNYNYLVNLKNSINI